MNKAKKNIVIVGFSDIEIRSIAAPEIGKNIYVNTMNEAKKHQGYLIIINNKSSTNVVEFDKKYRKTTNKYAKVWLYNKEYKDTYNKWSNTNFVNNDIFLLDSLNFWDEYDRYKFDIEHLETKTKHTHKKLIKLEKLYNYLKDYKTIKTSKIVDDLKISEKMVQRYMQDINNIYHNIGYDYSNNEWYIIW